MSYGSLLILLVTLAASSASAQYDEEAPPLELKGSGRFSLQTGWRYTPNTGFYDRYYSQVENRDLSRARGSIGGPLLTATFAYSFTNLIELGVDLFATYERMRLTGEPALNTVTYGALLGLRFQKQLELGPEGLIPFAGLLTGPLYAGAYFDGERAIETTNQALGVAMGATLRLSPKWGLALEYRLLLAKGEAEDVGKYNAGGHWFSLGMTYQFGHEPARPLSERF